MKPHNFGYNKATSRKSGLIGSEMNSERRMGLGSKPSSEQQSAGSERRMGLGTERQMGVVFLNLIQELGTIAPELSI